MIVMKIEKKYQFVVGALFGMSMVSVFLIYFQQNCINKWKSLSEKHLGLFLLMNQWTSVKQDNKKLEEYFIKNNYKRIAIYGMSYVGLSLIKELQDSQIEIVYGIDKNAASIYSKIKLLTIDDCLPEVDAVVITLINGFDKICEVLSEKIGCSIIAIEDIINEI